MYKSGQFFFLILLFLLAAKNVSAQDTLTAGAAENVSYRLYLRGSWDSLAAYCDRAIADGYDYYYMRMRAGIAYYKKTNYRKAIPHFEKALRFNASDDVANEYLYYCYVYSGEYDQARWLAKDFDSVFSAGAGIKKVPVSMLLLEGGTKLSSSNLFQPVVYGHAALAHYAYDRVSLFHGFTYYNQKESRYTINQYQYYLKANVPLKKQWSVSAGAQVVYNRNIYRDSVEVPPQQGFMGGGGPPQPPPPGQTNKVLTSVAKVEWNYLAGLTLTKSVAHFSAALGFTYWYRDTSSFSQLNGNVTCYPFANNLLALSGDVYVHSDNSFKNSFVSLAPAVTLNLKKWSITAAYLNNTGGNAIERTAYIVNNSEDLSRDRYTISLACRIRKKFSIYCTYNYETKEMTGKGLHYNYNTFIAGICFTPY